MVIKEEGWVVVKKESSCPGASEIVTGKGPVSPELSIDSTCGVVAADVEIGECSDGSGTCGAWRSRTDREDMRVHEV